MLPLYKWPGDKRREIAQISQFYPDFVKQNNTDWLYVEPFFGGGAIYWDIDAPKYIINDIDFYNMNFLEVIKYNHTKFMDIMKAIQDNIKDINDSEKAGTITKELAKTLRGLIYYDHRASHNDPATNNFIDIAVNFFCFNPMVF